MITSQKTVLLTGGTGFLGSVLVRLLSSAGHKITILKRSSSDTSKIQDLLDSNLVKTLDIDTENIEEEFSKSKFQIVIHAATSYGREGESLEEVRKVNFDLPMQLLRLAMGNKSEAFLNSDTFYELEGGLEQKDRAYILTKKDFLREATELISSGSDTKFLNLRIEHMYGPNDSLTKSIPILVRELKASHEVNFTSGENQRDFVYIDDVAQAFLNTIEHLDSLGHFEEFGIGSGETHPLKELVEKLQQYLGGSGNINWGVRPYAIGENMFSKADLSNNKKINWRAETSLDEGIRKTTEFYK